MGSSSGNSRGVAVVTGGTAGIGRATVRELARRGWDVGIIARGQDRLDEAVREVEAAGRRGFAFSADVADHEAVEWACGAKHAIKGFTESVRVELIHEGSKVKICAVHMPGVNTPQFDWVLHRGIDHHPMPVPPIYQPEVCARAIAHVAERPRRQMWVGLPTALTILGNRVAPALLDRYLAKTNVKGQQSPPHDPPGQQHNTWGPVYGAEIAAHGSFDDKAHAHSPELWLSEHRGLVGAAAAGVGALALAAARR